MVLNNLRALIDPKRRSGQGSGELTTAAQHWPLSLLYSGDPHDPLERSKHLLDALHRYGMCSRASHPRNHSSEMARVLITLRRLEDRGQIRGGRFVSGFLVNNSLAVPWNLCAQA